MIRDDINNYITNNYDRLITITNKIRKTNKDTTEDVLHECIINLLEKDDEQLEKIINYIDFYIINMIRYSFWSATSGYQTKYNRIIIKDEYDVSNDFSYNDNLIPTNLIDDMNITNNYFDEDLYDKIINNINKLDWYSKKVVEIKIDKNCGFLKISKDTGIPYSNLYYTWKKAIKKIKKI